MLVYAFVKLEKSRLSILLIAVAGTCDEDVRFCSLRSDSQATHSCLLLAKLRYCKWAWTAYERVFALARKGAIMSQLVQLFFYCS